jgi:hypothetical protein
MESIPRSAPLSILFVALAMVFVVLAVLYAVGAIQLLVTDTHSTHHYTHAILFAVLAVASLIAANFTRPRPA